LRRPSLQSITVQTRNFPFCLQPCGQALRREEGAEGLDVVVLREFFGGDASKTLQAELITKYLLHELACIKVRLV
jgi:hypothetical protein